MKKIALLLAALGLFVLIPSIANDGPGQDIHEVGQDVNEWTIDGQYSYQMVQAGGNGNADDLWFSTAHFDIEGDYTYVFVIVTDDELIQINGGEDYVKNSGITMNNSEIVSEENLGQAGDVTFQYLVKRPDGTFYFYDGTQTFGPDDVIVGWEARFMTDEDFLNSLGGDLDAYFESMLVHTNVFVDGDDGDNTSATCQDPDGCFPECPSDDCGGGSFPGIPIDGGLAYLLLAGMGMGIVHLRRKK